MRALPELILITICCFPLRASEPAAWPNSSGPSGNYLPLPAAGFAYIDHPDQAERLWESKVQYFGFGKSLSSPVSKFYDLEQRYPGTHSGNGGTPVVAEGLVFFNSLRPAGPADDLINRERTLEQIESKKKRSVERGMSQADADALGKRVALMWRHHAEDIYFALDAETGEVKWEVFKPGVNLPNGKRDIWKPSPAYLDGKVFALGTTGTVRAFNLQSGKMLWETDLGWSGEPKSWQSFEPDLIAADGRVIVPGARPIALDADTGKRVWSVGDKKTTIQGKWANPAIWLHDGKTFQLYTDGSQVNAKLRLIEAASGNIVWTHETDGPMCDPPVIVDDIAFATVAGQDVTFENKGKQETRRMPVRGGLKLSLNGPELLWSFKAGDLQFTYTPGPDKGVRRNSSAGSNGTFYYFPNGAPSSPRFMYRIKAATGEVLAKEYQAAKTAQGGFTKAPYVYEIGDRVLHFLSGAGGDNHFGRTNLRRADTLEKVGEGIPFEVENPISNYEVFGEHPIADGRIYIRTYRGTLVCYDLRKKP